MKIKSFLWLLLFANILQIQAQIHRQAQTISNYKIADSLFNDFTKNIVFLPDSLPLLSLSPKDFKLYIHDLTEKQLIVLDSFSTTNILDTVVKNQLVAKIRYKNYSYILTHPMNNGFFEVQKNELFPEEIKSFYRESYKDYGVFLDTIEISNDLYLPVNEYLSFLENYLNYQENRFHVFNTQNNCTKIDRYWLIRLLFVHEVRKYMATKELKELKKIFSEKELAFVLKDFRQKFEKY